MAEHRTPVLIIGSGAAGCTAAIYAARAGLKPILVRGMQPGGQLTITTEVENYPGFAAPIQGPWLMEQMEAQAEHVGTQMVHDTITSIDLSQRPFVAKGDSGDSYVAETVVVATGASARWLGAKGEQQFQNFGVSACATCDGFFYRDEVVCVVGGGNTAVEEALYLSNIASKVHLIHRRDKFRAEPIMNDKVLEKVAAGKIELHLFNVLDEVLGDQSGVAFHQLHAGGAARGGFKPQRAGAGEEVEHELTGARAGGDDARSGWAIRLSATSVWSTSGLFVWLDAVSGDSVGHRRCGGDCVCQVPRDFPAVGR